MKFSRTIFLIFFVTIFLSYYQLLGQSSTVLKLAILPFQSIGVDETTTQSTEALLRIEISKSGSTHLIPEDQILQTLNGNICTDIQCAINTGKKLEADRVVFCTLLTLGQKVIVHHVLIDIAANKILLDEK